MKKLVCLAVSVLYAATLIGCKGKTTTDFKPALDTKTACDISVVGDYKNFEALEAEFKRFNAYYPNVSLTYSKIDSYNDSIANVLERDDKPNIFFTYAYMSGNEKYASVFNHTENLSNTALKLDLDCIRPGLLNHDKDGNVVMVPVFSRTYGTLVNQNLFEKEGLSVPTTWNELLEVTASFIKKEYKSPMMGYSLKDGSCLMNVIAYPSFLAALANNPEALEKANELDSSAGEYMREALNQVDQLVKSKAINIDECDKIEDNYEKVLFRFLDGDVPMMLCTSDTASGINKRAKDYEAYKKSPFQYTFYPIPVTDKGGYFIDSPSVQFSVNKDCDNLDMTNEFMRFLVRKEELSNMASLKGLVTPTKEMSFDPFYAPFSQIPTDRTFSPEMLGVKDTLVGQIRKAAFKVGRGEMEVEVAVTKYGTF